VKLAQKRLGRGLLEPGRAAVTDRGASQAPGDLSGVRLRDDKPIASDKKDRLLAVARDRQHPGRSVPGRRPFQDAGQLARIDVFPRRPAGRRKSHGGHGLDSASAPRQPDLLGVHLRREHEAREKNAERADEPIDGEAHRGRKRCERPAADLPRRAVDDAKRRSDRCDKGLSLRLRRASRHAILPSRKRCPRRSPGRRDGRLPDSRTVPRRPRRARAARCTSGRGADRRSASPRSRRDA
jgi:hypothetical protein